MATLRLIPNLDVVRPADANETAAAWAQILADRKPAALILSRQDLTTFDRYGRRRSPTADGVAKGGYILIEASADAEGVIVGTGSEVEIAVAAREQLEADGVPTRVVSMPCVEWFAAQDDEYRAAVLPADAAKVVIEAGTVIGWKDVLGDQQRQRRPRPLRRLRGRQRPVQEVRHHRRRRRGEGAVAALSLP